MLHPLHCGWGQCCLFICYFYCGSCGVTHIPYGQTGRCPRAAVLVDGILLTPVLLLYGYFAWLLPSLMLVGVEAHMLLFAGTQIDRYLQQGYHNNISVSTASLRVATPPPTSTMSTSDDAVYSGRLPSPTRPIQEAQGEGRERSRSGELRRGGRDENLGDDSDSNTSRQQATPTDRLDSPVDEAEKLLSGAKASRRQMSQVSREHHQLSSEHHRRHLTSPRSTERLLQSYEDQRSHGGPSDSESDLSRARRVLDEANATLLRREERRRHDDERRRREDQALDQARAAAREASRAVERARHAIALPATSTPARATPSPARRWVFPLERHDKGTTLSCLAALSTWLPRRGSSSWRIWRRWS